MARPRVRRERKADPAHSSTMQLAMLFEPAGDNRSRAGVPPERRAACDSLSSRRSGFSGPFLGAHTFIRDMARAAFGALTSLGPKDTVITTAPQHLPGVWEHGKRNLCA